MSFKHRKRIADAFGWAKTIGGIAQTACRGIGFMRTLHQGHGSQQSRKAAEIVGGMTILGKHGMQLGRKIKAKPAAVKNNRPARRIFSAACQYD
ncbi:hypothetical protein EG244_13875 [Falsigemmobacter faecalis]|uniref:Uncharacterized protein n=1 Tax=Falsigemmobacter faecalis TaxID=2488730 RepID=A0A3P3DEP5_9RHOB|nr:hypothetical protein EG244_13875 [Falsigemmobacter faecalis]